MNRVFWFPIAGLFTALALVSSAHGQYIGYVYPAGGQLGTTVQVRLGGQRLTGCRGAVVSGEGVSAKLVKYYRKLSNQEMTLIREQSRELKRQLAQKTKARAKSKPKAKVRLTALDKKNQELVERIDKRMRMWVNRPACAALVEIADIELTIAPDAEPGPRDLRLITGRGLTNPMTVYVGQVPEVSRRPMKTSNFQVLGKEGLAQRKRPEEEVEVRITLPCTMNGQIASGEVNHYRFEATKGQQLVVSVKARELVPYIADAVPGWFQPVVSLHDAQGREVAFNDDFRFKPDPTFYYEVPEDGEYVLKITDAIYRGREDFVYRMTVSELPFVTSIFPLGGRAGDLPSPEMQGWNLTGMKLTALPKNAQPGLHYIRAIQGRRASNLVPFAVDTLPECFDHESNNDLAHAQQVKLPIIVNGRTDHPDDWDVFAFQGQAGQKIVTEVHARRLDSPMDSLLKITDAHGKVLAFNDDREDVGSGLNTHHADSYVMMELPEDGVYFVHLGDTARNGGEEFAYRLRISEPRPDFELRIVPSHASFRSKGSAAVNVYAIRKDGFDGDIKLSLKNPPEGFLSSRVTLPRTKDVVRMGLRTTLKATAEPLALTIQGTVEVGDREITNVAVASEDRMQAFLWRHLVPASEFTVLVYDPSYQPPAARVPPPLPPEMKQAQAAGPTKFTKRQVQGRLRQLKLLYEEWLLNDNFYHRKVAECESSL
jgi:hypothetical protein